MRYLLFILLCCNTQSILCQAIDDKLQSIVDRQLGYSEFDHANVTLTLLDIETNKLIAAHRPDKVLIPASSLKLITTLTGIKTLGSDYRFKTGLYYSGTILSLILISEPTRLRRISYAVFCLKKNQVSSVCLKSSIKKIGFSRKGVTVASGLSCAPATQAPSYQSSDSSSPPVTPTAQTRPARGLFIPYNLCVSVTLRAKKIFWA